MSVMQITCLERNLRDRYVLAQFFEWLLQDVIGLSRIGDKALTRKQFDAIGLTPRQTGRHTR